MKNSQDPNTTNAHDFRQRESISAWVLLRMGALLLVLGGLFLTFSLFALSQRFNAFDEAQYKQDLRRVALVISKDRDSFTAFLEDYANWNDSYSFIQNRNQEYVDSNFTTESMNIVGLNSALILDLSGAVILSRNRTQNNPLTNVDADLQKRLLAGIDLELLKSQKNAQVELLWINGVPLLRGVCATSNSSRSAVSNGFLVFAKELDKKFLMNISELTAVNFTLRPLNVSDAGSDTDRPVNGRWQLREALVGLNAQLIVAGETRLKSQRNVSTLLLISNAILLVGLTLFGIYQILNRRVLRRITEFSVLADQRRQSSAQHLRWPLRGRDELDNLALSLNEMLDELQSRHNELEHLSSHDSLTAMGNRRLLKRRLFEHQLSTACVQTTYLLLLNVDGFSLINDGVGHHAGDLVLCEIAQRLLAQLQHTDTAARLSADEFAVMCDLSNLDAAKAFVKKLQMSLAAPFTVENRNLILSVSVGIAIVRADLSVDENIRNADLAMFEAKRTGKGRYAVFNDNLLNQVARRNHLEQILRLALDNRELEVWFQPIVTPHDGAVVSMEALSRWKHDGNFIPPDEFIAIAENCGLINQLGYNVLDSACAALALLRVTYPELSASVNVSALQFVDGSLVNTINEILSSHNLPASALHLELTESAVANYEQDIFPVMQTLVGQGIHFYLDDFGTGYSSLDRLRELPFNTLKIDRSFVTPLRNGDDVMVRNIIRMSQDLGMNVVAEGVETEEELRHLLLLGCTQIQGYLFAKPMPLSSLLNWFAEHNDSLQYPRKKVGL